MPPNASGTKDKTYLYLANNQASNNDSGMADGQYGWLTVLHEIGHTLGLPHCPTKGCLMEDAMGKVTTTDGERDFCPACRALAKRNGFAITENPAAAWLRGR